MFLSHLSLRRTRELATLSRSIQLLRSFPQEQKDPAFFYNNLAEDTAQFVASLYSDAVVGGSAAAALRGTKVLDVGGGPGFFDTAFRARGCTYMTVEPDVGEMAAAGITLSRGVRGSGDALPFIDNAFDVVYSSNVAEHMPNPWDMGEQMLRVTRPGGLTIMSYTVWLGPFGGHETGLWQHYVGGEYARDRYTRKKGHPPKNVYGTSLFDVSCADGIAWARRARSSGQAKIVGFLPRYHPQWAWWLVRVPGLREFLVSNLVIVLRKKPF